VERAKTKALVVGKLRRKAHVYAQWNR